MREESFSVSQSLLRARRNFCVFNLLMYPRFREKQQSKSKTLNFSLFIFVHTQKRDSFSYLFLFNQSQTPAVLNQNYQQSLNQYIAKFTQD